MTINEYYRRIANAHAPGKGGVCPLCRMRRCHERSYAIAQLIAAGIKP